MKRHLVSALTLSLIAGLAGAADNTTSVAPASAQVANAKPVSGIAVEYIDPAVRAQDDLFTHMNGKWLATTEIPADKASWGSFAKLRDDVQPQLRAIIEGAAANQAGGPEAQRIGDFYTSFMDEAKLEQLGLTPLNAELAKIDAVNNKKQLPALIAHLNKIGVTAPYGYGIHQDNKDSTKYVVDLGQDGLGLPDRDYYLKADDKKLADALAKYELHVAKMLTMAGDAHGAITAHAIVEFEKELAKIQWTKVELRDPVKAYNKVDIAKLGKVAPGYDWNAYLTDAGVTGKVKYVIVGQPSYLKGMTALLAKTPLDTLKSYFRWHLLRSGAPYLSKAYVDENFAFYGTVLSGVTEQRPRWKRGVSVTEGALGEAVGKIYVEQNFPAERKARMQALVNNLLAAYKTSIDQLDWMSPVTKKQAQDKLAKFTTKIAYPNHWRDYSKLVVSKDDLVGNVLRSREFEYNKELAKLGKPIDREEWGMTPQTVNAYYNPEMNEIVFPASILQAPFFNADADDAVNYGAIGGVIGHEISHGFDDQGAQYDGDGNLRDWWTAQDHKNFAAKTKMLVEQYNQFSPLPGYHVNGELTLGENIADNSGVAIAYKAYKLSLGGKEAPVIDGLTGDQRFYMGFAQVWRMKMREAQQIVQIKTDPHSPGQFRANGPMRNQPGFYDAFNVKPGDKMYLEPKDRVIMW
ncbi:M13 family peptidase [Duganella sp. BJB488]|uniref:M13 family metallopeptidase n=1 Tax=unclassified Duganella TaxID=2636909 RepID=UPI000E356CFF|nr:MULTISPECIES: M13-type metalloendopeptidase [unclassified Duganella]RFP24306.1 M13 family peptidase [Duganella sp. BJB489]RFP26667.1 M13 family peptidase [Duganella sp. BJB488]RFP34601.1 M13 family peptidase [Duganella sp. BJB480]